MKIFSILCLNYFFFVCFSFICLVAANMRIIADYIEF